MRIEGLLVKEEFNTNLDFIRPSIDSVIEAAKGKKQNFYHTADIVHLYSITSALRH